MNRAKVLQDLRELLAFATSFWGLVCVASILLPIANLTANVIPVRSDIISLATIIAVVTSFFAFAYSFTEKSHILEFEMHRPFYRGEVINPRRDMLHNAASRLVWGLICLCAYIALDTAYAQFLSNDNEASKWLVPITAPIAAVFYGAAFALVTGAFGSLAVMQFCRSSSEAGTRRVNLGIASQNGAASPSQPLASSPDGVSDSQQQT